MKAIWKQLYTEKGILVYEGYTLHDKAYGEGTVYYPDCKIYQQGIFDIKGLIKGKEYYPNGQLRFGAISQEKRPSFPVLMWRDVDEEERKDYFNDNTRRD